MGGGGKPEYPLKKKQKKTDDELKKMPHTKVTRFKSLPKLEPAPQHLVSGGESRRANPDTRCRHTMTLTVGLKLGTRCWDRLPTLARGHTKPSAADNRVIYFPVLESVGMNGQIGKHSTHHN